MEIFTLLKANIRHKKGSFVSIIILMMIICMSFTAIFSIKNNCINSINNALDRVDAADLTLFVSNHELSKTLLDSVKNHASVKNVVSKEAVAVFGAEFGERNDTMVWYLLRLTPEYRQLNEKLSGYAEQTPELKEGEIYISQGIGTNLGCGIGDTIKLNTVGGVREFTVKGFIVEPAVGAMTIGSKIVFISDADFAKLQAEAIALGTEDHPADYRMLQIYQADKSVSDSQFKRQLNEDTRIVNYADGSLLRSQSLEYTNLFPEIILSVLLIFVGFLVAIVIIVMAHSISTSIEMEYTSLGVLKAQGFTESKIKVIFAAQYLAAEVVGAVIGIILAVPLIKFFGNIFQPILAIPSQNHISLGASLLFTVSVLAISALFVAIITRKVGKISPMKAISGDKDDIYFTSRMNAPVSKKALSASLALRQFTSAKRRYIGTVVIIAILMYFMISMNVLGASMDSDSAMESMGMFPWDLSLEYHEPVSDSQEEQIENIIKKYTEIDKKYSRSGQYMTLDGNEYYCVVYENPEVIIMAEGRCPRYENEITITEILADELGLKIGDKVTAANRDFHAEYIVTGFHVDASDAGLNFAMPLVAGKKMGIQEIAYHAYTLKDDSQCVAIADEINQKYSDIVTAAVEEDSAMDLYEVARNAMTVIIYAISVVFSLVVVMMFCKKAFLQERRDIGIYKSLGFTSGKLRLQFAVRFLIVALIGSVLGSVLSLCFTQPVLTMVFRLLGISSFNARFTPVSFLVPVAIIAVSFFAFAYLASGKIKRVEIKELVIE
jgi:ABC-type antimicrobial peptide transport system permease subunit